jgi:hypothetical protein
MTCNWWCSTDCTELELMMFFGLYWTWTDDVLRIVLNLSQCRHVQSDDTFVLDIATDAIIARAAPFDGQIQIDTDRYWATVVSSWTLVCKFNENQHCHWKSILTFEVKRRENLWFQFHGFTLRLPQHNQTQHLKTIHPVFWNWKFVVLIAKAYYIQMTELRWAGQNSGPNRSQNWNWYWLSFIWRSARKNNQFMQV